MILLSIFTMFSCGDDDNNNLEEPLLFNCCGNTSLDNTDINNLDESAGVIMPFEVITVNGDGLNDLFFPQNINLYPNNEVTIYNTNDDVVFSGMGYGLNNVFFPLNSNSTTFPEGTYRYKIVIENEQTYVNNGFFCLIKPISIEDAIDYQGQFTFCTVADPNDPFLQ
nr:gliding motility-associated C-terminal domain-containing protein [uncultured Psychroserpens sp.]